MTTLCEESFHSLLGLTSSLEQTTENILAFKCHSPHRICFTGDDHTHGSNGNNIVIESAVVTPSPPSPMGAKRDPGGIGFIDDIGGSVDGLMSCTESLGFESSDERRVDDQTDDIQISPSSNRHDNDQEFYCWRRSGGGEATARWRKVGDGKREAKRFPPPLSSLNINGQPSFFLLPERRDGRLELTEVRIQRPEILRASRQDGRLRLHLVRDEDAQDFSHEEEEEEEVEEEQIGIEVQEKETEQEEKKEQETEKKEREEEKNRGKEEVAAAVEEVGEEESEERKCGEWKFPGSSGEGFTRCHHNQHHHQYHSNHHHLLVWRQHCVTTG